MRIVKQCFSRDRLDSAAEGAILVEDLLPGEIAGVRTRFVSIRGLGRLADSWEQDPPFANDSKFAGAIRDYRRQVIANYGGASASRAELRGWLRDSQPTLDKVNGLNPIEGPAIVAIASILEEDAAFVADLGALNLWPERTTVPLGRYLSLWEQSCRVHGASGRLPARLRNLFGVEGDSGR